MLNFKEFQEYVAMNLLEYFPKEYQDVVVTLHQVTKNNGRELHAVSVRREDSNIAPNIYLDEYFKKYEEVGDVGIIMEQISKTAMEHLHVPDEYASLGEHFLQFDFVKDKIIMVAINAEKNQTLLAGAPHQYREDLALIYKVMLVDVQGGMATITIQNEHMKHWGVTPEELHDLAMKNTKELLPVTVQSMNEVMRELFAQDGMPEEMIEALAEEVPIKQQMFVISNAAKMNGAASIFYEDSLVNLAEEMGTDLFILPSSVHECIAVSTEMGNPETLAEMVQEVNGTQVAEEERLSDHVYRFDAKERTLSLADTTMEQLEMKVSEHVATYEAAQNQNEVTRPRHCR